MDGWRVIGRQRRKVLLQLFPDLKDSPGAQRGQWII